jgi:DNA-binding transcriptional LysR family regulator
MVFQCLEALEAIMTLTQARILVAVADMGSVTRAARHLHVSQSSVSHIIARLEKDWAVTLLERNGKPTPALQRILPRLRALLIQDDAITQEILTVQGQYTGQLSIGSFGPSASVRLLPMWLHAFALRHPRIQVGVLEGTDADVMQWLRDHRVDVGFVTLPNAEFVTLPIHTDQLVAVLPENHVLAQQEQLRLRDLIDQPFILTGGGSAQLVERAFAQARLNLHPRFQLAQISSILHFVRLGLGISVIAQLALPDDLNGICVRSLEPTIERKIGLATLGGQSCTLAARAFLDVIAQL